MTPKEKAHELVFKMDVMPDKCVMFLDKDEIFESAKKAALILVGNMEKFMEDRSLEWVGWVEDVNFWNEVRNEINKL